MDWAAWGDRRTPTTVSRECLGSTRRLTLASFPSPPPPAIVACSTSSTLHTENINSCGPFILKTLIAVVKTQKEARLRGFGSICKRSVESNHL